MPTDAQESPQKTMVLVIDEDRDFLADCVMPLLREGFDVLTAIDSQEAQYLCELYPRPIHLVVLDLPLEPRRSLPDMSPRQYGNKIIAMVRVQRPQSRILLTSPTPSWKMSRQRLGATLWQFPWLYRPCSDTEMLQKIHVILQRDPGSPPPALSMGRCA